MEENKNQVRETVSAGKKLGEAEARKLIRDAKKIYIAKGKKLDEFDGGRATKDIVEKMLGSTGNLRAPTIKASKNLVVGFNAELYEKVLS